MRKQKLFGALACVLLPMILCRGNACRRVIKYEGGLPLDDIHHASHGDDILNLWFG